MGGLPHKLSQVAATLVSSQSVTEGALLACLGPMCCCAAGCVAWCQGTNQHCTSDKALNASDKALSGGEPSRLLTRKLCAPPTAGGREREGGRARARTAWAGGRRDKPTRLEPLESRRKNAAEALQ